MANITLKQIFGKEDVQAKMNELLGKKASGFITSVLQIAHNNTMLSNADPSTIYNAAMTAAALDLPINQNLGFAYIVPYGKAAQFQMGWKGYVQLAQRTGQYKAINVIEVYESQFNSFNTLTEELDADFSVEPSGAIIGYAAYFKLLNGFEKVDFWTIKKVETHAKRFSKSFNSGPWKTDFDAMAKKTVLKSMLSKWGILSIEMQTANISDQAVIDDYETGAVRYPDNDDFEEVETKIKIADGDIQKIKQGILSGEYDLDDMKERYHFTDAQLEILTKP
jgi:recombination protein RecT